ncbi:hypothetical protein N4R57_08355 [Rhodobacteraceae bacterium D3-12]|nr:hypothetical protein N4R57_08355 [Rhodobacteraceae bacterium D3-12]
MTAETISLSRHAAFTGKVFSVMKVILHIGAQRTATTSFQAYLRGNTDWLSKRGVGYWGPHRTRRGGLFSGLVRGSEQELAGEIEKAKREIGARVERLAKQGKTHLIVSDENMLGTARLNVRAKQLYPDAAQHLERFARAFDGMVSGVVLSVRSLETYWPSALAFSLGRGGHLARADELDQIVEGPRGWRDVVSDTSAAFSGVDVTVDSYETYAPQPEKRLAYMTDGAVELPETHARLWLHRSPDLAQLRRAFAQRGGNPAKLPSGEGRWLPFDEVQSAKLKENYADDLFWLHAGAGGVATFVEEDQPDQAGANPSGGATTRGHKNDGKDGRMARAG